VFPVAKIPGLDLVTTGVVSVMQAQTAALAALPGAVESLSAAVRNLAEVTAGAKETVERMNRLAAKCEALVDELTPGLHRVASVLDDPVVSDLPDVVTQVRRDMLPVLRTLADTNERILSLASLPGASTLLGWRRPATPES
jgi:ABC-type transporter Mla subunit MlaD